MQGLPDRWILRVLLEVHDLLEVHLRVVGFLCVNAKRLLVVAYALLDFLTAVVSASEGKHRMRARSALLLTGVGVIRVEPTRQVLFLLRFDGSLSPRVAHLLLAIVVERLRP